MYKVSVMYPNQKDCHFDLEYYRTKHMALVEKHMKPFHQEEYQIWISRPY